MTDTGEPGGGSRRPPAKKAATTPRKAGTRKAAKPPGKLAATKAATPRKAVPNKAVTKKAVTPKAVAKKAVAKKAPATKVTPTPRKRPAKNAVTAVEPVAPVTQVDEPTVSDQAAPPPPPPPPAPAGPPPPAPTAEAATAEAATTEGSTAAPPPAEAPVTEGPPPSAPQPPSGPPPPGGYQAPPPPPPGWAPPGAAPQWGPPATPRNEGTAIAAFVLGLVSIPFNPIILLPVLAVVLGIVALRRIKKNPGRKGRGLAITGIVLGIVMTMVGVAVDAAIVLFLRDTSTYEELKPGDCVKDPGDEFILIVNQSCNGRHEQEVFATLDNPAPSSAPYPGNAELLTYAQAECSARFPETGTVPPRSELQQIVLFPSRSRWEDGERRIVCLVGRVDDAPLTAPLQGVG